MNIGVNSFIGSLFILLGIFLFFISFSFIPPILFFVLFGTVLIYFDIKFEGNWNESQNPTNAKKESKEYR